MIKKLRMIYKSLNSEQKSLLYLTFCMGYVYIVLTNIIIYLLT
jgi:hypothetical protein